MVDVMRFYDFVVVVVVPLLLSLLLQFVFVANVVAAPNREEGVAPLSSLSLQIARDGARISSKCGLAVVGVMGAL